MHHNVAHYYLCMHYYVTVHKQIGHNAQKCENIYYTRRMHDIVGASLSE